MLPTTFSMQQPPIPMMPGSMVAPRTPEAAMLRMETSNVGVACIPVCECANPLLRKKQLT